MATGLKTGRGSLESEITKMAQKKKVLVTTESARGSAKTAKAEREPKSVAASKQAGGPSSAKVKAEAETLAKKSKVSTGELSNTAAVNTKATAIKTEAEKSTAEAPKAGVKAAAAPSRKAVEKPSGAAAGNSRVGRSAPVQQRTAAMAKPTQAKISAPVAPKDAAAKADPKKSVQQRHGFKMNEYIVYPTHGVGRIVGIEEQEIAGMTLELFVITFEKDKMTLRVPTGKLESVGMRKLADEDIVGKAMETLKGRARIKRTMWSRRAQEYEAKINSGDLVAIAEVVRDLYRSESQPEQSYSERQLYEAALDRMAREIAAVEKLDERGAVQRITDVLSKSARGRRPATEGADDDEDAEEIQAA